jgi:hypothetical protein
MPHLDADPELLAALLIHLELARDDQAADPVGSPADEEQAAAPPPDDCAPH